MKIATWNVNSINVRLSHVLTWLESAQPDVLVLQETKCVDEKFPRDKLEAAGYQAAFSGQKTYNGVAIISKHAIEDVITDVADLDDPQRRILGATINGVRILDLYVVNGSEVGSDKFDYKLNWLEKVSIHIKNELTDHSDYVVLGDFNIAPADADVNDPKAWHERILCSTPERDALKRILDLGFTDTFRLFKQEENSFSWWDYRMNGFRRNRGLRIDLILASSSLAKKCTASEIDKEPRGWERPSDHAPVMASFEP
ncbi:exodeoxyribonuclease III [Solemya pervernicosa gill symbiont]|uniref:Exodeoxyribonuclease III n=2 Tax=Gammaproteobacteria incertae sedis TaxID=118884 RepID=A0A1T2L7Z8_9GAMM|nr:exodeoxyribonuclease III [Candidatus Reidiella endopervernicosa]OOZ41227.1 exodeoxyribonuclease III [Solemya pervernicosa gill symbiont]QKQ25288.1 exodeoxyribonuclease III [Candidatus Reidiella endopervernicosa]